MNDPLSAQLAKLRIDRAKHPARFGQIVIAGVQASGALLGVFAWVATWPIDFGRGVRAVSALVPILLFALVLWQAVLLWRADTRATRRMAYVIAAQIPSFNYRADVRIGFDLFEKQPFGVEWSTVFRPNYDFFMLFKFAVRWGPHDEPVDISAGTKLELFVEGLREANFFAINLAALGMLTYLLWLTARSPDKVAEGA